MPDGAPPRPKNQVAENPFARPKGPTTDPVRPGQPQVILGIDPGIGTTGFGVVERRGSRRFRFLSTGTITTKPRTPDPDRLVILHRDMREIIERYAPDVVAIEKLFFSKNVTTGIQVSQARGVLLLACGEQQLPVFEYSPVEIKASVAGYGDAKKGAVQDMVKRLLDLPDRPRPDDAADALAIALCHGFRSGFAGRIAGQ